MTMIRNYVDITDSRVFWGWSISVYDTHLTILEMGTNGLDWGSHQIMVF